MKKQYILIIALLILSPLYSNGQDSARKIADFNFGWKFYAGDPAGAKDKDFDDQDWEQVQIPHDWAIEQEFDHSLSANTGKLPWQGTGWYRKEFNPEAAGESRVYILFDGIMAFPEVFVNGQKAGEWDYGYSSFYLDVTDLIERNGRNILAVKADTRKHASRWYPGAGIYRKVQLVVTDPVHTNIWGSYITTPVVTSRHARVRAMHEISNMMSEDIKAKVEMQIISPEGFVVATKTAKEKLTAGKKDNLVENWFDLKSPALWDIESPVLYKLKTNIYVNNRLRDSYTTLFGIRQFEFTSDKGFFLNGRHLQIKGVNLHHDHGPLGAKFYVRAMHRQLRIMKEMGCNAIRTSHNVPSPDLLALCDTMGFIVMDEAFDKYNATAGITPETDFEEFAERNIRNFITRDRNHPSIVIWSAGNEIQEVQMNRDGGLKKLHTIVNLIRKYDPTRPVTLANDNTAGVYYRHFDFYDVHSWNYGRRYLPARNADPDKNVIITESASTVSTRGYYELPLPEEKTDFGEGFQISSYDMNAPWWAEPPDYDFHWQEMDEYVSGEFVWTGFDYLGEPTPFIRYIQGDKMNNEDFSRSSYFGIVDLVGIPKDRYYLYKSVWKPEEDMIHILPHWNWRGSGYDSIPVFVYTNGDCAELFVNGKSIGMKCKDPVSDSSLLRYRIMFPPVKYEEGNISATAYKQGKKIAEKTINTSGEVAELRLSADRREMNNSGYDLSYILVEAYDKDGNFCPLADDELHFRVEGPAVAEGAGNGNPHSFDAFTDNRVDLFYGKAMIILRAEKDSKGPVKLEVTNGKLKTSQKLQVF